MKNLFFLTALIGLLLVSCSDDQQSEQFDTVISNPNNPYDFIGKNHNDALLFAANKIDIYNSTDLELYNAIHQFGNENNYSPVAKVPYIAVIEDYCPSGCDFNSYVQSAGISDKDRLSNFTKLQELVFIPDFKKSDTPRIISDIIAYENDLLQQDKSNAAILGTISILRHSLYFWYSADRDINHPYHLWVENTEFFKTGPWLVRLAVDAVTYDSCMEEGAGAKFQEYDDAHAICTNDASYASARAFG